MTPTRKPAAHRFREREIRHGWVGEASVAQPSLEDRLLTASMGDTQIALGGPVRITRIIHDGHVTLYHLTDGTIITAPRGARITWEDQ